MTTEQLPNGTLWTYENGVTLLAYGNKGAGTVAIPRRGEVGPFDFPVKNVRDVFASFQENGALSKNIPAHCKGW